VRQIVNLARRGRSFSLPITACLVAIAVAACGGSSSPQTSDPGVSTGGGSAQARQILKQTFGGQHPIKSGTMNVQLTLTPAGSTLVKGPVTLSIGGPFQSNGSGKIPDSDYTINANFEGHTIKLQLISAGGHGYITVDKNSYQLPAADYQRLESGVTSISGHSDKSSTIGKLGIDPMNWLSDAQVAGSASIDGTATTKVTATVNTTQLVSAFKKVLSNSSSLGLGSGGKVPTSLTPSELGQIAETIGHPKFSLWSANSDHSLRRLQVTDQLSVNGEIASAIGGLSGVGVDFSLGYGDLNQPQTITAPTDLKPYSQFQSKLTQLESALEYIVLASESGGSSSSGSTTGSGASNPKYTQCLQQAGSNVTKLQKCQADL
jgi:hypothetical protein